MKELNDQSHVSVGGIATLGLILGSAIALLTLVCICWPSFGKFVEKLIPV
jgi:hypothetical protein